MDFSTLWHMSTSPLMMCITVSLRFSRYLKYYNAVRVILQVAFSLHGVFDIQMCCRWGSSSVALLLQSNSRVCSLIPLQGRVGLFPPFQNHQQCPSEPLGTCVLMNKRKGLSRAATYECRHHRVCRDLSRAGSCSPGGQLIHSPTSRVQDFLFPSWSHLLSVLAFQFFNFLIFANLVSV